MLIPTSKTNYVMAYKLEIFLFTTFFLLISKSFSETSQSDPTTPATICTYTPHPSYCKSLLPNTPSNVYDYGRYTIRKSLASTTNFLNLINGYLDRKSSFSSTVAAALEDCQILVTLNIDFLTKSLNTVDSISQTLPLEKAEDTQTLLSAILTNTQTCQDSLQEASPDSVVQNDVYAPTYNSTKLYSVSLALFTKGWVPRNKTKTMKPSKMHLRFGRGEMNLKMSPKNKAIYDHARGGKPRRFLQSSASSDEGVVLVSDIVVVGKDGIFNFTKINDAIGAAPNNTNGTSGYFLIYVTAGVYQDEYVSIPKNKKYLMMLGDGINETVITGNRSVVDGWTTFDCATFTVVAQGFLAVDIAFRNTAGPIKHQAVAVRNGADLSTFYRCSFDGYQDTLYIHSLRQFYKECDIYGTVDFIFGNAVSVFQNCNIYPKLPMIGQYNAITAQGRTDPNQNTGISIQNCTIKAADDLLSSINLVKTYLGRPWKEYSRVVYMQSYMDTSINHLGWRRWNDSDFALNTSYYAEFDNWGQGSDPSRRVTWPCFHVINATEAANFTISIFLLGDNWLPQTGVPYTGGLS